MRYFDGASNLSTATRYLNGAAAFTISVWCKPTSLTPTSSQLVYSGSLAGSYWGINAGTTSGEFGFSSNGHGGSDPTTSSGFPITAAHQSSGVFIAYRYDGTEWSSWVNGTKTVISASISFSLVASTDNAVVGVLFDGDVGEVAIWDAALTAAQMADLGRGVSAHNFPTSRVAYWRVTGNSSPELDYDAFPAAGTTLSVTGAIKSTFNALGHPATYGPDIVTAPQPAWLLEVQHGDGTQYAASRDLYGRLEPTKPFLSASV